MNDRDLTRHARVSLDNRHRCVECFCCACATVREEKAKDAFDKRRAARDIAS